MFRRKQHQEDWERLTEYVAGEGSEQEQAEIRARVAVDEEQARLLREIQAVWEATGRPDDGVDVEAGWKRLEEKVGKVARIYPLSESSESTQRASSNRLSPTAPGTSRRHPSRAAAGRPSHHPHDRSSVPDRMGHRPSVFHLVRIAGVIVGAVALVVLSSRLWQLPGNTLSAPAPAEDVFATNRGERALIRLNDGTTVRLNVESKLVVPQQFAADARRVSVEGEAYFDVAEDSERPFVVDAGEAHVEVLGTQFNVWAQPERGEVEVVVAGGQVALSRTQAVEDTVVLRQRHRGLVRDRGVQVVQRDVNLESYLAWTSGRLMFSSASFQEVARTLERCYNLRVEFEGPMRGLEEIDVVFEEESLANILKVIAATLNLHYEWEEDTVTFFRAPADRTREGLTSSHSRR